MEKPNANEKEHAMGFRTNTTAMKGISKGTHSWILGQVMDFNYLTWIFSLILAK
jgi:hypothetical protein